MNFLEYTAGRSIALVGPAPLDRDYTADIDAHDLVYRVGLGDRLPPGTGQRVDIVFLNGRQGRLIDTEPEAAEFAGFAGATWWVFKNKNVYPPEGRYYRRADRPGIHNPNQATHALFDLVQYDTGPITVYGVDLYAGGLDGAYNPEYGAFAMIPDRAAHINAFLGHRPLEQLAIHRAVVAAGRIVGTDRYLEVASMTDQEYDATVIRPWRDALKALT